MFQNPFFQNVEKKTGVKMDDLLQLANSMQNANFKDEATVRSLIQQVAKIANKQVNKELEDKIVDMILNRSNEVNMQTISEMLNKK